METKHTPGPWVAIHEPGSDLPDIIDNGGYRIDAPNDRVTQLAFVWVLNHRLPADGGPQESGERFGDVRAGANARLIAAAPDLVSPWLAADDKDWDHLFRMLPESGHGQFWRAVFHQHRAAIAKATALSETQKQG